MRPRVGMNWAAGRRVAGEGVEGGKCPTTGRTTRGTRLFLVLTALLLFSGLTLLAVKLFHDIATRPPASAHEKTPASRRKAGA